MGNMKQELAMLENKIFEKFRVFATLKPEHLTSKHEPMVILSNYQRGKLKREYDEWYTKKYPDVFIKKAYRKKSKYAINEDRELEEYLEVAKEILKKVVLKMDFNLDPIQIAMADENGEFVSKVDFDFGNFEVLIDEIYQKRHFMRFLGVRLESMKTIKILHAIVKVS